MFLFKAGLASSIVGNCHSTASGSFQAIIRVAYYCRLNRLGVTVVGNSSHLPILSRPWQAAGMPRVLALASGSPKHAIGRGAHTAPPPRHSGYTVHHNAATATGCVDAVATLAGGWKLTLARALPSRDSAPMAGAAPRSVARPQSSGYTCRPRSMLYPRCSDPGVLSAKTVK